ncbi:uncharacterized protein LOC110007300 [Amborella trichopoda]|uniref:uncharacterized protein LOC110007300 n=1 Tax=Amborella trichopoda TaxID=13333 RepID=UPI0009BDE8C0|nr:uncharacterized protein LOC110007300 [Amborella trichopoda]|eukprot:XP_020523092.1 uncharacterized protein LOC110007300 [Amborella trichopoda]
MHISKYVQFVETYSYFHDTLESGLESRTLGECSRGCLPLSNINTSDVSNTSGTSYDNQTEVEESQDDQAEVEDTSETHKAGLKEKDSIMAPPRSPLAQLIVDGLCIRWMFKVLSYMVTFKKMSIRVFIRAILKKRRNVL